jgi:hypothetical protein
VGAAGFVPHIIDGQKRPVAFASTSLKAAERNYSPHDCEALAVVFSVDHILQLFVPKTLQAGN